MEIMMKQHAIDNKRSRACGIIKTADHSRPTL